MSIGGVVLSEKLLEVSVVARRLTISVDTVRRLIKDADSPLKGIRVGKKCFRVFESSVETFIESRKTN